MNYLGKKPSISAEEQQIDRAKPYTGRRVAFLTQHGKERVVAPVLEAACGCCIERAAGYDTDQLGTFTRDIPRFGTQLEAARRKARIGMQLSGLPLGLASEGSFGRDPVAGLYSWNVELLVFIDDERGIEVCGMFQGPGGGEHLCTDEWAAVQAFADQVGFPAQHLVLRPENEHDLRVRKGIADTSGLQAAFAWAQRLSTTGRVFAERDLRAHAYPGRMENIRCAAADLATRLNSTCPACGSHGYAPVDRVAGLPCGGCGVPTREVRADIWGCVRCEHRATRVRADAVRADPAHCDRCNP